ncbi:MAG: tyrosine--tRNA ligase [Acidobacteria bacterium RIFCSPLOWO2_02_FULL_68_18]|nr:MAG: tyrosine--tRNA ligase [Acidobacteria bacterium RIFCSPLOWO2_02_FULL_68_18]OFW50074.1 MAG: tyrosine--tRNA ligase [Acidobacteria bacterium RIFCSPLOWO2_12_FULL_68_19]
MDLYGELAWRGLVYDATEGVRELLAREKVAAYIGFDPTASSLHVGSLLPILALARLQQFGHAPIAVVGGGTGLIGDPSGKTAERQLLTAERVEANVEGIRRQLERFLDFESTTAPARLVNNAEWLAKLSAISFMRDVGKHFSVNAMLARDSVKRRIEGDEGISYTEFSYALLQAYDYLVLYDRFKCVLQMGGSDQWGNITAGMDLIRRVRGGRAYGLVLPLITTASGAKFGKTEAGAVWLDAQLTRPYEFYQFWINADDRDAATYLRFFTYLPQNRIAELEAAAAREPERRHAQRELAREVTRLVHGEAGVREAEAATDALFGGDLSGMSVNELLRVFPNVPSSTTPYTPEGWPVVDLLVSAGVTSSKSEATRLIRSGGIYVNSRRITDEKERLRPDAAVEGQLFVVRKGKRDNYLIRIVRGVSSHK